MSKNRYHISFLGFRPCDMDWRGASCWARWPGCLAVHSPPCLGCGCRAGGRPHRPGCGCAPAGNPTSRTPGGRLLSHTRSAGPRPIPAGRLAPVRVAVSGAEGSPRRRPQLGPVTTYPYGGAAASAPGWRALYRPLVLHSALSPVVSWYVRLRWGPRRAPRSPPPGNRAIGARGPGKRRSQG